MKIAHPRNLMLASVAVVFLAASLYLARRPYYNWDMFPYMALVLWESEKPFDSIHAAVYNTARENMQAKDFQAISSRQPTLMNDPSAFLEVLPYFQVKPGYTLLSRFFFSLGINPLTATWLPSIIGYFGLCLTLFLWSATKAPVTAAGLFTAIVATSPPLTDLARYSSPDMLASFVFLVGMVMTISGRLHIAMALFTATLSIRPDAILLTVPVTLALWYANKLSARQAVGWSVTGIALVAMLFVGKDLLGQYVLADLSINERWNAYSNGMNAVWHSYMPPLAVVAVVILLIRRRFVAPDLPSLLLWACLISLTARYLLHPFAEDRFNLMAYLTILVVAWETSSARLYSRWMG